MENIHILPEVGTKIFDSSKRPETIVDVHNRGKRQELLVQWQGHDPTEGSWVSRQVFHNEYLKIFAAMRTQYLFMGKVLLCSKNIYVN